MRRDIQLMRGIAVLAVVLYHAGIPFFANGYLGVDIFFVISGFLITTIVLRGLGSGEFSFSTFYLRRARRLLPALYSTLIVTTLLAFLFLTDRQWGDYRSQLWGALSFTSNMVLPFQTGYFADAAESRPLLHIWSLSLEEQYYFLLPLILFLVGRQLRGAVILVLTLASFALCHWLISLGQPFSWAPEVNSADWAFYLLPARAWQLLAGSLLAWWMLRYPATKVPGLLKIASLVTLAALLVYSVDDSLLRGNAVGVVLLTVLLLAGRDDWLPDWFPFRMIERVGDFSYSLYLVHWPLMAFAFVAYLEQVPQSVYYGIVVVSLLLSYLQYRLVEQRFRYVGQQRPGRDIARLGLATAGILILATPAALLLVRGESAERPDFTEVRRPNTGLHWRCSQRGAFQALPECSESETPAVAVWGDSYAMHLMPGLQLNGQTRGQLVQITTSNCNPALGLTMLLSTLPRAETCIEFNAGAMQYILDTASIEHVILSSPFGYFYGGKKFLYQGDLIGADHGLAVQALSDTVARLQRAGKTVVIVSPTPSADFDVGSCLERRNTGAIILGRYDCDIRVDTHIRRQTPVIAGLQEVAKATGVQMLWLSDLLCGTQVCQTERDGIALYRDQGHLSVRGSQMLLRDIDIFPADDR